MCIRDSKYTIHHVNVKPVALTLVDHRDLVGEMQEVSTEEAVSYTHLPQPRQQLPELRPELRSVDPEQLRQGSPERSQHSAPVSYTHLDVYKRQG